MIVIVLLLTLIIAFLGCLVRKDLKHSMIFAFSIIIIIGMYLWLFTLLPVQWGLKRMPFIEQAQIRDVSANDYDIKCNYPIYDGVIEFVTDKKLYDCLLVLAGSNISNFSWNDCIGDDSSVILTSYDMVFAEEMNDKFFYKALFITEQPNENILRDSIYCKIFMIRMFAPIYETNEFAIPYNKLFQMKNRVYNKIEPTAERCSLSNYYKQQKNGNNMIKYISGDILQSKDEYIAQGVAVGSQEGLGTGLAFKLSSQFPEIQKLFKKYTRNTKFQAGDMFIGEIKGFSPGIIYIATQPDMYHAELTYLNKGLKRLKKVCESRGIKTVSLPKIGAGLGKLDWNSEVKPLLESILSDCETVFNVYEDYKIEYEN